VLVWMRPAVELTKAEVSLHGSNYAALALPRRVDASVLPSQRGLASARSGIFCLTFAQDIGDSKLNA